MFLWQSTALIYGYGMKETKDKYKWQKWFYTISKKINTKKSRRKA